jgi:hypothetical protein
MTKALRIAVGVRRFPDGWHLFKLFQSRAICVAYSSFVTG